MLKSKTVANAAWIIACYVVQAMINIVVNMLMARYLGPSNFGIINYAASIVMFAVPIMQLGLDATLVQEIVEHPEKEGETVGTALCLNALASVVSIIGVVSFAVIANHDEPVTILVCGLYSLNLLFQAIRMIRYWFQAKLLSKYTSIVTMIAYMIVSLYRIILLITEQSIYWFAISQALDYMLIAIALLVIYKALGGQKLSCSKERAKQMISKSRYYILSALMVTIFSQTDKIMLKLMIGDAETGLYSAAAACAGLTSFVFVAIIDSARPTVIKSKNTDQRSYEKNMSLLYAVVIALALLQSVFISVFAEWIIAILYGAEYAASVDILRLIVWYTTFSYIGAVRNVWILAENKHRYLWVINLTGALTNVALNAFLIPVWGGMGAALATLVTQIFTNVIIGFILAPIRPNNVLMLRAFHPKVWIDGMKRVMK